jgi:ELWxxDGT repeat protein
VSDGTDAGTHLVKDVNPGAASSQGSYATLAAVRDRLFFLADDGTHGFELWVSDGTDAGTHLVKDVLPGAAGALISQLTPLGNRLLFSAADGTHGGEPWVSDGTAAGTTMIQDIAPGAQSSGPLKFTSASSRVYFLADDGTTGSELWSVPRAALGTTFTDVPTTYWAWDAVEAVADAGITLGCASDQYCPDRTLTRAEMGVFLGRALHGGGFVPPPATGTRFDDVPVSYWAAGWIELIAADGITQGCSASPPLYCPGAQVSRAEMAVFLLRARHGGSYVPPPATGTRFADVPASYWAAPWIEQLAAEGITNGCDVGLYCPGRTVARAEMAVFLARAFHLPLP